MKGLRIAVFAALAALLAACGGGTGGTGVTSNPPTNALSIGVMTKGSVILNGVHYDDSNATTIKIDDTTKASADLQSGMVVKVAGMINADGSTGSAQQVKALVEVRGIPDQVNATANPPSLHVLNQTVFINDQTIFSGPSNSIADITKDVTLIEVHGLRDSLGNILATRIETVQAQMADATVDEIRGVVSNLNTSSNPVTFNLGPQAIAVANGATILPNGATIANGIVVEVHCARPCIGGGAFQASVIDVEEAQDQAFQPGNGERYEVEGLVSGFSATPGSFFVGGTPVTTTPSTQFDGGLATDLANDVQVEAEGTFDPTTHSLLATKIEFKRSVIRLQGTTATATATGFDMQMDDGTITIAVVVDSQTIGLIPPNGTCVQVRGQRQSPATTPAVVLAGEIDPSCSGGGGGGNRTVIQAPVEVENGTMLTLLGIPIDVGAPTDPAPYQGLNGPLSQAQFFAAVTPAGTDANGVSHAGTLVKVTFDSGAATVHQAEIEDEQ